MGIFFKDYKGDIIVVSSKVLTDMESGGWKDAEQINLDEYWLNVFNFKYKKSSGYGGQDMWAGMGFITDGDIEFRGNTSSLKLSGYFNSRIDSVHKLQNICFLLKDYEIKPNIELTKLIH